MKRRVQNLTYSKHYFTKRLGIRENLRNDRTNEELSNTLRYQQGMTFKIKKVSGRFIHTLSDGQLLYKFGLTPEQVLGKELYDFLPNEMASLKIQYYDRAWNGEENVVYEGTLNNITYLASLKPIKNENGLVVEVIASCIDISERKLIEMELLEANSKYRCLVETTLVGVFMFQKNQIVYCNPRFAEIYGYTQEEILTMDPFLLIVEEERQQLTQQTNEVFSDTGTYFRHVFHGLRKNGTVLEVEIHANISFYHNKHAIIGMITDISDKQRAQEIISESDKHYRRLVKLSPEPIVLHDADLTIIYVNKSAIKLMGAFRKKQLLGKSLFNMIDPTHHEIFAKRISRVVSSNKSLDFMELTLHSLKGGSIKVEFSSIFIYKYVKKPFIQTVFRDISERKKGEEMLIQSEKLSVVGQLAAGVAHEIRNPLTAIKGFLQLLNKKCSEAHEYIDIMLTELDRINFIVNEFMILAKPQEVQFHGRNIKNIVNSVVPIIETQSILHNVQIITDLAEKSPLVRCDENQLKQVLINLIKNAIDSMPAGGIVKIKENIDKEYIVLQIMDQGVGMSPEFIKKVGEPFFTTKENGTGLGLMVSYKIIENHGGRIDIESQLNVGTTVSVSLPIYEYVDWTHIER